MSIIRSPFFYVGDKYKLMKQLKDIFPVDINQFIEPFVGGGSVFLNTNAKMFHVNDLDSNIYGLHRLFSKYKDKPEVFLQHLMDIIKEYKLSCSFKGKTVPESLKLKYKKTHYAHYNKQNYLKMRDDYNKNKNEKLLYLLLVYGFNHMLRFNKKGDFNLPVGNVDFNNNVHTAITNYLNFVSKNDLHLYNMDYQDFINRLEISKKDFVYFDPPYFLSNSEYNKMWTEKNEKELYSLIDELDEKGIRFGISNLLVDKNGVENDILSKWMDKYHVYDIKSNYISYHDNSIKKMNKEVYVTNVKKTST